MEDNSTNRIRRPLKVVIHGDENFQTPKTNGGGHKVFNPSSVAAARVRFQGVVRDIAAHFEERFLKSENARGVARIVLKKEARAKSYRPTALFKDNTCPIIGYDDFGTLLVGMSKSGVEKLVERFAQTSEVVTAAVSTIQSIEPYVAIPPDWEADLHRGDFVKLRIFNHGDEKVNAAIKEDLDAVTKELGIDIPVELDYAESLRIYKVRCKSKSQLEKLASFYGTQSVSEFMEFGDYREGERTFVGPSEFEFPAVDSTAPVVGLLDSGVSSSVKGLEEWVVGRDDEDVPEVDRDYEHGTFIAGLLVSGKELNDKHPGFPAERCRIFDAIVMPKGGTNEFLLLQSIRRVVEAHGEIRVWNLSSNLRNKTCSLEAFSPFAMALDELQVKNKCIIVCSAGNFNAPLRKFPPRDPDSVYDRVSPPAENVLGVTVGSVAHVDSKKAFVRKGQPSPFSRKGPSSGYIQKPDVCHYGGNCEASGECAGLGVKSCYVDGRVFYWIGTSFSAPLVANTLAHLMANDGMSTNLAKALLIHSAVRNTPRINKGNFNYIGYGVPGTLTGITTCESWSATLVFETTMMPSKRRYDHTDFPLPKCLMKGNGFNGEITMTLVCDPFLNPRAGAEYCRTNIKASIGVQGEPNQDGYIGQERMINPLPRELHGQYENDLVKTGQKWNAVKVYRQRCEDLAISGDWGVRLDVSYRDDHERVPQDFALVVTISDPEEKAPVYDMVEQMLAENARWNVRDLKVENKLPQRMRIRR